MVNRKSLENIYCIPYACIYSFQFITLKALIRNCYRQTLKQQQQCIHPRRVKGSDSVHKRKSYSVHTAIYWNIWLWFTYNGFIIRRLLVVAPKYTFWAIPDCGFNGNYVTITSEIKDKTTFPNLSSVNHYIWSFVLSNKCNEDIAICG